MERKETKGEFSDKHGVQHFFTNGGWLILCALTVRRWTGNRWRPRRWREPQKWAWSTTWPPAASHRMSERRERTQRKGEGLRGHDCIINIAQKVIGCPLPTVKDPHSSGVSLLYRSLWRTLPVQTVAISWLVQSNQIKKKKAQKHFLSHGNNHTQCSENAIIL